MFSLLEVQLVSIEEDDDNGRGPYSAWSGHRTLSSTLHRCAMLHDIPGHEMFLWDSLEFLLELHSPSRVIASRPPTTIDCWFQRVVHMHGYTPQNSSYSGGKDRGPVARYAQPDRLR
jgi:hypothetical protein